MEEVGALGRQEAIQEVSDGVYQGIDCATTGLAFTAQYRWFDANTFRGVDSRGERATRTLHGSNIDLGIRFGF